MNEKYVTLNINNNLVYKIAILMYEFVKIYFKLNYYIWICLTVYINAAQLRKSDYHTSFKDPMTELEGVLRNE